MTISGSDLEWFKSSHSTDDGPACVEVATTPAVVRVRDSKNAHGPHLGFTPDPWTAFVAFAVTSSPS
ncbi:DUF397 domain-containing protein [Streptomyces sp. NPDC059466]|uniref:DUF397 domain-containing protein n=1 Tax=unclassified Streptomyces TaxID=2593676 RepID=UPI003684AC8B